MESGGREANKVGLVQEERGPGVFNVAATKDFWLASTVQQVLSTVPGPTGSKIMVTERPGRSVKSNICTANPFPRATCDRLLCPEARRGEECNDRCYRESVGYAARCRRCCAVQLAQGTAEEEVKHQVYLGESSRSLPTRLESHIRDYVQDMKKKGKEE